MAINDKIGNAKQALSDSKTRTVVAFLVIIVLVISIIVVVKVRRATHPAAGGAASEVQGVPQITSIPGMGQPTREYSKLIEQQNTQQAEEAAKTGTSAIPTIVRTTYINSGVATDLTKGTGAASSVGCSPDELKRARAAGVAAEELRCRGCSLAALLAAGYTAAELRAAGFSAKELRDAGVSAKDLREAGFNASELAGAGFSAKELKNAGYLPGELANAGFQAKDLQDAGFSEQDVKNATTHTATKAAVANQCSVDQLRLARGRGETAASLKQLGCGIDALRAAGFTAAELRAAGFSAKELKDAGFSARELSAAGFSAADLRNAGFSAAALKDAGFSAAELKAAGFTAGELKNAGYSASDLKALGYNAKDLKAAGYNAKDLLGTGLSNADLKNAGYSDGDLIRAGAKLSAPVPTLDEVAATCNPEKLKAARSNGVAASVLKASGCSSAALVAAGFTFDELKAAGFTESELRAAGFILEAPKPAQSGQGVVVGERKTVAAVASSNDAEADWKKQLDEIRRQSEAKMSAQDYQDRLRQIQQGMVSQGNQYFGEWKPIAGQQYVEGTKEPAATAGGSGGLMVGNYTQGTGATSGGERQALINADIYKAGTILFGVLETGINSDEVSPILATIVSGPLKGSKLVGAFNRVDKKVVVQFNMMNVEKLSKSVSVNAVAIDPNTARTALASNVDNHYMLRYGTIFASSFMTGVAQAVQNSGSTVTQVSGVGSTIVTPALSTAQSVLVGLGSVGTALSTDFAKFNNTPPTVIVKPGGSIGILLMADLEVPKG
jgi:intracellular multiplication protein IcmE